MPDKRKLIAMIVPEYEHEWLYGVWRRARMVQTETFRVDVPPAVLLDYIAGMEARDEAFGTISLQRDKRPYAFTLTAVMPEGMTRISTLVGVVTMHEQDVTRSQVTLRAYPSIIALGCVFIAILIALLGGLVLFGGIIGGGDMIGPLVTALAFAFVALTLLSLWDRGLAFAWVKGHLLRAGEAAQSQHTG